MLGGEFSLFRWNVQKIGMHLFKPRHSEGGAACCQLYFNPYNVQITHTNVLYSLDVKLPLSFVHLALNVSKGTKKAKPASKKDTDASVSVWPHF